MIMLHKNILYMVVNRPVYSSKLRPCVFVCLLMFAECIFRLPVSAGNK
jgi:hypothetical protein